MVLTTKDIGKEMTGKCLHSLLKETVPVRDLGGKVSSVNVKPNSVVLHFKNKDDLATAKAAITPKLAATPMKVRDNPVLHPRLIIFNVDKSITAESVTSSLTAHLSPEDKSVTHIQFIRSINCKSHTHHHLVLEVPGPVFTYHQHRGSVLLEDWSSCRLAEARRVLQCNHCGGFGHRAADCKRAKARCLFCAGDHAISACTHRDNPDKALCLHCAVDNRHRTNSPICPVYKNECLKVQARITY
jgi:hypothetical protein